MIAVGWVGGRAGARVSGNAAAPRAHAWTGIRDIHRVATSGEAYTQKVGRPRSWLRKEIAIGGDGGRPERRISPVRDVRQTFAYRPAATRSIWGAICAIRARLSTVWAGSWLGGRVGSAVRAAGAETRRGVASLGSVIACAGIGDIHGRPIGLPAGRAGGQTRAAFVKRRKLTGPSRCG